jgi:hypothetical protein
MALFVSGQTPPPFLPKAVVVSSTCVNKRARLAAIVGRRMMARHEGCRASYARSWPGAHATPISPRARSEPPPAQSVHHGPGTAGLPGCGNREQHVETTGTTRSPARAHVLAPLFPVYGCRFRNPPPSTERASGWGRERLSCRAAVLVTVAPAGCLLPREWVNQQIDSTGRKQHLALLKLLVFKTHKVWVDHGYAALLLLFFVHRIPLSLLKHKHQHYSCKLRIVSFQSNSSQDDLCD